VLRRSSKLSVDWRFSVLNDTYLANDNEMCIYGPQCWAKALGGINGHQVAAGKRLESLDEQLMLIIPVNGCYNASSVVTVGA
ncbi:hypothetical protein L195_g010082, partial [Trifolium pratense]